MAWPTQPNGKPVKGLRAAVLLRRSEGETGNTGNQLDRINPLINDLQKKGLIKKVNRKVVGKPMDGSRFDSKRDLAIKGDIYNEGRAVSGFSVKDRPVLDELIRRLEAGQYDVVLMETMDRFGRDYGIMARYALPLWRDDGIVFFSLTENIGLGYNFPINEAIVNTTMTWGGVAKQEEIQKSKKAGFKKIERGYVSRPAVAFIGDGTKAAGISYREAYDVMKAEGETPRGTLKNPVGVGRKFGKDNKWASKYYLIMKELETAGVLEDWFNAIQAVNDYIRNHPLGERPGNAYKSPEVKRILTATSGYFNYPLGVILGTDWNGNENSTFVKFPYPLDVGLDKIASVPTPVGLEGWNVEVIEDYDGIRLDPMLQKQTRKSRRSRRGSR